MEEKKWVVKKKGDPEVVDRLSNELNIEPILAQLLVQRNITNFDQAKSFFRPELKDLHDPFLMVDMEKAVERLNRAIQKNERILVYGDYDVDGTTSVALMYSFLHQFHKNIEYYIPDRYSEGYGISEKSIDYAAEKGVGLVVALDCGIKAIEKIDMANEKGIDYIICDHHTPDDILPKAYAILDPKREDSTYPFKELSGCGVGFKLIQAFLTENNMDMTMAYEYLDILAVSIASDIVPLTGENRILAHFGLKKINTQPSVALKAIMEVSELDKHILISDIVFKIGPRINAAGRMDSGQMAVDLLVTKDLDEARAISLKINNENKSRKDIDRQITREALDLVMQEGLTENKSIVLFNPNWLKGVIGIVASRLVEHFYKPTIIFTRSNGLITGSARSVVGFNIYEAITDVADLLENYGGHMYAAGLSIKEENFAIFKQRFEEAVRKRIKPDQTVQKIIADAIIKLEDITPKFFRILKQFEPFGPENMAPVFISENLYDSGFSRCVGKDGKHLKLMVTDKKGGETMFAAIAFNQAEHWHKVADKSNFSICYSIDENTYRDKTTLQLRIKDIHFKEDSKPKENEVTNSTKKSS
ncbi:MAG: single-stranded-DNA-specific exonuclease RecJ [Salinivirgaceae bacterium]|nr:MAG: single-stranded-DNA-specific exonuclease RecJ [Salinivirgaceae bacterium]